ncbi:uncharacterized protein C8Q71DRAFT_141005 [Rhodofomes roseus]|uniref:Uncharacterized protein n=1 Tax=Rhodofomes roseus TaxID=34475 RepID=A0ABQ8KAM2_9APHY|nr:uncharacterized protein C8Q71DRAFT_141005 [Rhodofomes roseus]KAH9834433.1 hypothetical protein C8Q71DRAFT_141005 [Rhodofomes roseus]
MPYERSACRRQGCYDELSDKRVSGRKGGPYATSCVPNERAADKPDIRDLAHSLDDEYRECLSSECHCQCLTAFCFIGTILVVASRVQSVQRARCVLAGDLPSTVVDVNAPYIILTKVSHTRHEQTLCVPLMGSLSDRPEHCRHAVSWHTC